MLLPEVKDLPGSLVSFVPCGSNSEVVRDIEQRCGPNVFLGKTLNPQSNLKEVLLKGGIFPDGYFNDFVCENRLVKVVHPEKVAILEGETYQQFCIRMRAQCDLYTLPANALHALCINFDASLYQRPCVITKINQTKLSGFQITSAFVIHLNAVTLSPEIAWIQFSSFAKLNTDFDYLFTDS